jgi:hypothetical protein
VFALLAIGKREIAEQDPTGCGADFMLLRLIVLYEELVAFGTCSAQRKKSGARR